MVKKTFLYIFIYTLLVGCDTQSILTNETSEECVSNCYLKVSAPSLQIDENGYYHMEWLEGYNQTFSTLDANTGSDVITKVMWDSDSGINYSGYWVSSVNPASYTNDGVAHTVLSAWEEQIGDTLTIYAGYMDECGIEYIDSIKVVVDNEIQN
tara:strand:+ start:386 stop:844 length:459 start_codon:yes stop_codon:yes gene_type:complete